MYLNLSSTFHHREIIKDYVKNLSILDPLPAVKFELNSLLITELYLNLSSTFHREIIKDYVNFELIVEKLNYI